jgi:ATP-dependent DNA helicase DinG
MISPASLGFPAHFTDWTPGQFATIAQVASHLAQPDAPITILEAPTGVGKSVIAEALIRLLKPQRAVILTGTKQLQEQYASAFAPALHNVMGRGNFPCLIDSSKTAADALCTVGYPCHLKKSTGPKNFPECPYFAQREQAQVAPEIVTNYPYWLAQANYAHKFKADLLICDEAHTLEEEVRRFASVGIRKSHIDLALGTGLPVIHTIGDWKTWAKETLADLKGDYREAQATKASLSSGEHKQHRAVISLYEACQQLADDADATDDNWVIEPQSWGVNLRPVWVSKYMERYVLRHARKVLCMSATILDPEVFSWTLGLPPEKTAFIRVPSRFPKENRPLNYRPVGKVKGGANLAQILPTLVGAVDQILDQHPNERGLIHTVSYEIARAVAQRSRHKARLIGHDSANRSRALTIFKQSRNSVLISPSMSTGVDLPYDLCRFQVICKLAFPYLGDPQIKKRMKLGPDGQPSPLANAWYKWMTACTLVQTYGRGVRAIDDACVSYLLDGNWDWFKHTVKDMLPDWFTEAIVKQTISVPNPVLDLDAIIAQARTAPLATSSV